MADQSVFKIKETLTPDESIEAYNYHEYLPFNGQEQLNVVGNIQIDVMPTTAPYHLHNAYLKLEGKIVKSEGDPNGLGVNDVVTLTCGGPVFSFKQVTYQLNGVNISTIYEPGYVVLMKQLLLTSTDSNLATNCFEKDSSQVNTLTGNDGMKIRQAFTTKSPDPPGSFSIRVPLRLLFSFADDYTRVLMNTRQTLILVRRNDDNALIRDNVASKDLECRIEYTKIALMLPLITPSDSFRAEMLKVIRNRDKFPIIYHDDSMSTINLPKTKDHTINLGIQMTRPRYLVFGIQKARHDDQAKNNCTFDHLQMQNLYVMLNNQRFPDVDQQIDFKKYHVLEPCLAFLDFYKNYYHVDPIVAKARMSITEYVTCYPLFVVNLSHQSPNFTENCINLSLHFSLKEQIEDDTTKIRIWIVSEKMIHLKSTGESLNVVF